MTYRFSKKDMPYNLMAWLNESGHSDGLFVTPFGVLNIRWHNTWIYDWVNVHVVPQEMYEGKHFDCPFCGKSEEYHLPRQTKSGYYFVECDHCFARSSVESTPQEAWQKWSLAGLVMQGIKS